MLYTYNQLVDKLDLFIKRYYYNLLLKGLLWFVTGIGSVFLLIVFTEYLGYLGSVTRAVLFWGFIIYAFVILWFFVLKPLAGLLKVGKSIDFDDAAKILGKHFKEDINDRITNTLQLKKYLDQKPENSELILASIEQRSEKLAVFPFVKAVDYRVNAKYLPPALFIILLIISGWLLFPLLFKEPAQRIVQYNEAFSRPAPFSLVFENAIPLQAVRHGRFNLKVSTVGSIIPASLDIKVDGTRYPMVTRGKNSFEYEFRSLQKPVTFFITSGNFSFGPYSINLINKALIRNVAITANYPSYTGFGTENFMNVGDISIPEGTTIEWQVYTEETSEVIFSGEDQDSLINQARSGLFTFNKTIRADFDYSLVAYNENGLGDSLHYNISVVPDMFPRISIQEFQDSIMFSHIFFEGLIRDDYGFTDLSFFYRKRAKNEEDEKVEEQRINLPFTQELSQNFYHHFNISEVGLKPGQTLEYYFSVSDNDAVNGPKTSLSNIYSFYFPDYDELLAETLQSGENIESNLSNSKEEVQNIQKEIDDLRRSMLESETLSWEHQEALQNLLEKQKQAQENYEQLQEYTQSRNVRDQQLGQQDENIRQKQEELQKLFEEVLSDEMKDLYQKIQDELEKMDRSQVFEMLDQFQFEMSDFENRLDRALELFKQLQVERMLSESIQALDRMNEKQEELIEQLNNEGISEELTDEQSDISKDFDGLRDLLQEMMKKNEELSRPNPLDDTSDQQENIHKELEKALEQLNKSNPGDAAEGQRGASDEMQRLQQQLQSMQSQMQQENLAEDIRTLREILDNLLKTSFGQEDLLLETRLINTRDPKYTGLIQEQSKISNDLKMIKDSLNALAKRQIQIQSIVSREISEITMNIDQAIDHMINRRKHTATQRQQFVMTHVNNLALLLNESMQNMQMQMEGIGADGDPGGEGMGLPDLRQMQEQMNEMLEQLQQGHQPMPGESGEGMGMSEQLARMAAEQEAIRNRLNELSQELRQDGNETRELEQIIRDMERTEMDIVTNNVTRQTQLRQQRILTRLLEHENAQLQREQEERRVGETAKSFDLSNPEDFFEYNRLKHRGIEMLRSISPGFKSHYKSLVENYFLNVE